MDPLRITTVVEDWEYMTSLPVHEASFWMCLLTAFLLYLWLKRPYRFPPGPIFVPIYGSWSFVRFWRGPPPNVLSIFSTLRDKYGGIFSVGWFSRKVVVLADYQSMREALIKQGQDFAGRPPTIHQEPSHCGILNSAYNERWKQQRHAFTTALRNMSSSKGIIETTIIEEIKHLKKYILTQRQMPFNPQDSIQNALIHVFSAVAFGQRFDYDTSDFGEMKRVIEEQLHIFSPDDATGSLHCWLPSDKGASKEELRKIEKFTNYLKRRIQSHRSRKGYQNDDNDFVSAYESIVNSRKIENRMLPVLHDDVYMAGLETSVSALTWALYYLAAYPGVQQKAYTDIIKVLGHDRTPTLQDRERLPYVEAVVMETLRLSGTLPLATPHVTRCDTEVSGYRIPRGTLVCVFLWSVLRDPTRWPQPEVFNPQRHLNDSGRVQNRECYIPFGIGRRACPGEQFAGNLLFLFVTSLIRDFVIQTPQSCPLPVPAGTFGTTYTPPPFVISFQARS